MFSNNKSVWCNYVIYYVFIFDTKVRKVVLYIQTVLILLTIFGTSIFIKIDSHFDTVRLVVIQMIFSVVFTIVYLLAAREVRARIRRMNTFFRRN